MTWGLIAAFTLIFSICITIPAYAYLDPGTGSMIIQVIIGVVAGALVTLKVFWSKIKAFFNRSQTQDKS